MYRKDEIWWYRDVFSSTQYARLASFKTQSSCIASISACSHGQARGLHIKDGLYTADVTLQEMLVL